MTTIHFPETDNHTMTDAQWAANQAALAMQAGRFALGEAFARIALRAHIAQLHQSSTELPVSPATPHFNAAARDTGFFGETEQFVPRTNRCAARLITATGGIPGETNTTECHAVIVERTYGDTPDAYWAHLDPRLDNHHPAECAAAAADPS